MKGTQKEHKIFAEKGFAKMPQCEGRITENT